jgi:hypothetical protein
MGTIAIPLFLVIILLAAILWRLSEIIDKLKKQYFLKPYIYSHCCL